METHTLHLRSILRSEVKGTTGDLVSRQVGAVLRGKLEEAIAAYAEPCVVNLDFLGVGIVDFGCADEVFVRMVSRLLGGEYADRYFVLTALSSAQRENIHVALEQRRLCVWGASLPEKLPATVSSTMRRGKLVRGQWETLGMVLPYLADTLKVILDRGRVTAKELAEALSLELNTASTRLINLNKSRLVYRHEEVLKDGGRQYVYESVDRITQGDRKEAGT
ncbi:MAG: hypothetical protein HYZ53_00600 [Planctomycetes bacterium]|nr:hypothetical protein [Planctomycetota bacterium]